MYRITIVASPILMLTLAASSCAALPTAGCLEYEHCPTGYYCETAVRLCRKCIGCEELGRASPAVDSCVKSVVECGECLEGLAPGPAHTHCGPAESPRWWWAVLAAALLFAVLIGALIVLVLRNFDTYKILACTTAQSHAASTSGVPASAPLAPHAPPPPYNTVVALPAGHSEESLPFIKPLSAGDAAGAGGGAPRGAAESQAATVFTNPNYVRHAHLPSHDTPILPDSLSTIQEVSSDNSIGQSHSTLASGEEESPLPVAERAEKPVEACQWYDNDNNNNAAPAPPDPTPDDDNTGRGAGGGSTAIIINLLNNAHNVAQVNQLNT